jgi:signal transduction histidine kinase
VDARHAVWDLRAPASVEGDFPTALHSTAADALRGTDLVLTYDVVGARQPLGAPIEITLARVLQEAIANTVKHADARTVAVELKYQKRGLRLTVADDGHGFLVDSDLRSYGGHWGLLGMQERAGQLCGTLHVTSAPEQGTTIVVRLPYPAWAGCQPIAAIMPA